MVLVSYLSYLVAELLHLSGIIALFVCGILMGHYVHLNLSAVSKMATGVSF
jgi:sodium/hydrogen exchanger 8